MDFKPFQLITSKELSKLIQVERHTITQWAKRGMIPNIKLGKVWRFDVEEVFNYLKKERNLESIHKKNKCEHNGYTIRNVCNNCQEYLNQEQSDRCSNSA